MRSLRELLDHLVHTEPIPSISLCVRVRGEEVFHHTCGVSQLPSEPAVGDLAYDLASVTKVLAGTPVAAALIRAGTLALREPVSRWLSDVDPRIRVVDLLTHCSGYPAHIKFYERLAGRSWGTVATKRAVLRAARATPLTGPPGAHHCYSDVGFLVLLDLLETAGGAPFSALHQQLVLGGERDLRWGWPQAAATEDCPHRGRVVRGSVHDLNCAFIGGISTHAGLFGTARGVAALAEQLMRAASTDDPVLAELMDTRGAGHHRAGFDGVSEGYTSTGSHFPPDTVGHLGYTGTSVWMVRSRQTVVALLTNRVHPTDDKQAIRRVRPVVHDAVAGALGWDKTGA